MNAFIKIAPWEKLVMKIHTSISMVTKPNKRKYKFNKSLIYTFFSFLCFSVSAQKNVVLNGPKSGQVNARESITMLPDFETTNGDFVIVNNIYVPPVLTATSGDELNYVFTRNLRKEISDTSKILNLLLNDISQQVQYFDGLGRPIQTVAIGASPNENDIVTPVHYDEFGRETEKYLSYTVEGNGQFQSNAIEDQKAWYNNKTITLQADSRPFTKITYENSPLNRIFSQLGTGEAWKEDNNITFKYETNAANEVIYWEVDSGKCKFKNYYAPGELYKNIIKDENGNINTEYKDKQGLVILKIGEEDTKTYYVYDDFSLLRFVIPPKAVEANGKKNLDKNILKNLCYYYEYDARKRMTLKKLPEAGSVTMKYDDRDRLIETQDSMQRSRGEVTFITYDELNRPVRTGIRFSSNKADTLTYTFYDDYSFIPALKLTINYSDESKYITNVTDKVKGRITGTRSKILGENKFITSVSYYDKYGRVVQTQTINQFGQIDKVTSQYHFWGGVEKTMQLHKFDASHELTIEQKFQYDHTGRLLSTSESVNGANPVIIAKMTYDELGQLATKELNASSSKPLQKIDYTYNIRGWLTGINPSFNSDEKDLFGLNLYYNDTTGVGPLKGEPQYNGNISSLKWRSNHEVETGYKYQAYGFNYDKLNRLTSSKYGITNTSGVFPDEYMNRYNEENLKYDSNGNLLNLSRTGAYKDGNSLRYGQMDSLKYRYFSNSNQLMSISDNSSITGYGYNDLNADTTDFAYDGNGNLTRYKDKKIKSIEYNYLNLPKKITFDDSDSIVYIYDANGVKHLKKFFENGKQKNAEYYIGNIIYETDSSDLTADKLRFVMNSEGRWLKLKNGSFRPEYFLKDHLGNTRVVFADTSGNGTPSIIQETNYYPFGLAFTGVDQKTDKNKFLYNGKELQVDGNLGMYDYGARFYDPQVGRWHNIDALMEYHFNYTPYAYVYNNPVDFIDPMGLDSIKAEDYPINPGKEGDNIILNPVIVTPENNGTRPTNYVEWGLILYGEGGHDGTNPLAKGPWIDFDILSWLGKWGKWDPKKFGKPKNPIPKDREEMVKKSIEEAGKVKSDKDIKMETGDNTDAHGKPLDSNTNSEVNSINGQGKYKNWKRNDDGTYQDPTGDSLLLIGHKGDSLLYIQDYSVSTNGITSKNGRHQESVKNKK